MRGSMQQQLRPCSVAAVLPPRQLLGKPLLAAPTLAHRPCKGSHVVSAGGKKKLKQQLEDLSEELERKLAELEVAYARNKVLQITEPAATGSAQLQGSSSGGAPKPPPLDFGDLAAAALQLVKQVEDIEAATSSLLEGLQSFAGRIVALSGPVTDAGVSALPPTASLLLGSVDAAMRSQAPPLAAKPAAPGTHAIHNDQTQSGSGDLGVMVTSASPPQDVTNRQPASTGYPTNIDEVFGREPETEELQPFAAQVQAAVNAVRDRDILNEEIDYIAEGKRLLQQHHAAVQPAAQPSALQSPPPRAAASAVPAAPAVPTPPAPPASTASGSAAGPAAARKPPAAPSARPKPEPAPFGKSGVSISKNLGRQAPGALSDEQLRALRADVYAPQHEDGSLPVPGNWGPSSSQNSTTSPLPQQHPAASAAPEGEPDLGKEQPGDEGYMAAVRAAMEQLSPRKASDATAGPSGAAAPDDAPGLAGDAASAAGGPSDAAPGSAKEAPNGPPPVLSAGADDIFWVNQLQAALLRAGCYPGEDEMEEWLFLDGTSSALLTFQAMNGLEETGVADHPTWAALLGPELQPVFDSPLPDDDPAHAETNSPGDDANPAASQVNPAAQPAAAPAWNSLFSGANGAANGSANRSAGASAPAQPSARASAPAAQQRIARPAHAGPPPSKWPVVRMDDGGREVHWLQCALEEAGCYPGEDDMMWWQFGTATESALRTFQGMNGLPETGVSDAGTWRALLGQAAQPADLVGLHSKEAQFDDDMAEHTASVWLLGEQRWSRPL